MGFHHLAIATRNVAATHSFYTEGMGFRLVHVEPGKTPEGGWAKHLFYDTGGGEMIAFWDIHDSGLPDDWQPSISRGLGLPEWTNHVAFDAPDLDGIAEATERWLAYGCDVIEIDHRWCVSVYTRDPNKILVEFCTTTRPFDEKDAALALERLNDPNPELLSPPDTKIHRSEGKPRWLAL